MPKPNSLRRNRPSLARLLLLVLSLAGAAAQAAEVRIAAASDLRYALPEMLDLFERQTGIRAGASFGSSGNLSRQLQQGAPFDLFFSADEAYADRLSERGLTRDGGKIYGVGRLVLRPIGGIDQQQVLIAIVVVIQKGRTAAQGLGEKANEGGSHRAGSPARSAPARASSLPCGCAARA